MAESEQEQIEEFKTTLAPFLSNNQYSTIEKRGKSYYIVYPWKDKSVILKISPQNVDDLSRNLNKVILTPRFTGIYHLDSNSMEFIYTLLDDKDVYCSRQFEFNLEGKTYICKFGRSSDRTLCIAKNFRPTSLETNTDYRNLVMYSLYTNPEITKSMGFEAQFLRDKIPISLYIDGFDNYSEDVIIELSKHINFFTHYYDRESPAIIIHSIERESEPVKQLQFLDSSFPSKISTSRHNSFLLDLAFAARRSEYRLRYLYYYQILEYASFYYVDETIRKELVKIISTPDVCSRPDRYIAKILDVFGNTRLEDDTKIEKTIRESCTYEDIWNELEPNIEYFKNRHEFEGGYLVEPLLQGDTTRENFKVICFPKIFYELRNLRNALVHGREKRIGSVIAPSSENDEKLKPWIPIIRRIAEKAMIFGKIIEG